ncbi:MAG: cyclopropane-fatty-acyl-phospholipid synthase family protein [Acidimicrobiia bacterium]|nr:cyclopropane-fatty-acyl-phospholipid synthase family protein [Acidimicrobiia bacterium]
MAIASMAEVKERMVRVGIGLAERRAPDRLVRRAMRAAVERRLAAEIGRPAIDRARWRREWADGPIALVPDEANRQHYDVPPEFFELILGPRLKYSSALWETGTNDTLAQAEERMLDLTITQAGITDGMRILDLGCGWGSLSLRIAERFPAAQVVAISNSKPQGDFIRGRAASWPGGPLVNIEHRVVDVNALADADFGDRFDRIVTVEMLEHVRNHRRLFGELAELLHPDGALYLHVFAHRNLFWPFTDEGSVNWMARYFFTGGIMPSHDLFGEILDPIGWDGVGGPPLEVNRRWWFNGTYYARTLDAWLARLDANRAAVVDVLRPVYGTDTDVWVQRWRMFLMACSELFDYADGSEWGVSHQLLTRP